MGGPRLQNVVIRIRRGKKYEVIRTNLESNQGHLGEIPRGTH